MSMRVDSASLIPSALVIGNNGLGVKGADLPTDGQDGNSILYELANLLAENDVEFRMLVTSQPSGELTTFEDGSFIYDGVSSSFNVEWFKGGVSQGAESISLTIGSGGVVGVVSTLGQIDYASNSTVVSLDDSLNIPTTLGAISYSSNNTNVSLQGTISVNATLGAINYTTNPLSVRIGGIWQDKIPATTTWTNQDGVTTIWTDKA